MPSTHRLLVPVGAMLLLVFSQAVPNARPARAQVTIRDHAEGPLMRPLVRPWLRVSGSYRLRYEHLSNPPGRSADDERYVVHRLLARADARRGLVIGGVELLDARVFGMRDDTPISTSVVNAAELLEAYVGIGFSDATLRMGRLTMDVGSRRFVARNRFRNTINAFSGVEVRYQDPDALRLTGFYVSPVQRLPATRGALRDNEVERDRAYFDIRFWGTVAGYGSLPLSSEGAVYVFRLNEKDVPDVATRNRKITTWGLRWGRPPGAWWMDFELEIALQRGSALSTLEEDDHRFLGQRAYFAHGHVAFSVSTLGSPRVVVHYDYASGDRDPGDSELNRFDPLFGARRFELGPTGLYGLLSRSNISTPGGRVEFIPFGGIEIMLAYRAVWQPSSTDEGATIGDVSRRLRPGEKQGHFIGHQLETRLRASMLDDVVEFETGAATLARSRHLLDQTRGDVGGGPSDLGGPVFFYASATVYMP